MMPLIIFRVQKDGEFKESPALGTGDIVELKKLFPVNPIWSNDPGTASNVCYVSMKQARALYDEMARYYAENPVSDRQYQTGNFSGQFKVVSDLLSVFDEMIEFFEKVLGFTSADEISQTIKAKQQKRKEQKEQARAEYRATALSLFEKLGTLKPPRDDALRSRLAAKLLEYRQRLVPYRNMHPDLAFQTKPDFQDLAFKILVTERVLDLGKEGGKQELVLVDLLAEQQERYGDHFDARVLFNACGVISVYLGTPLPGCQITS